MRNFNYRDLKNRLWDNEIISFISEIHEYKGKQEFYIIQKFNELSRLIEITKIRSTEASNEIEGIRTTYTRLKQICSEKIAPKNRDEQEIAGYRDALNTIFENFEYIPLTTNYILQLHKILYRQQASQHHIGGHFKQVQNYISATGENGENFTLFTPLPPYETPIAIDKICKEFNQTIAEDKIDPLILIPIFIHDFLCIHPFIDGNGRMSRLLTTLLLCQSGYHVGKYVSLEAIISKSKDMYYDSLEEAQINWHEGKENPVSFIKYLLGVILSAYKDLEERISSIAPKLNTTDIVRKAIDVHLGKFTKAKLLELCPSVNVKSLEATLKKLADNGEIVKHGQGKSTFYTKKSL